MTEPIFSETTERLWSRMPDVYAREDEPNNWQFKKFIAAVADRAGELETLIDRFTYNSPEDGPGHRTSDLVDPDTADVAWLPWLAQLVGVQLSARDIATDKRQQITNALGGNRPGTKAAMIAAAQKVLVGTKTVQIFDHSINAPGDSSSEWDVMIVTAVTESLTNELSVPAATMSSTASWKSSTYKENLFTNDTWSVAGGMTLGSGTTNALVNGAYRTLVGVGTANLASGASAGLKYSVKLALRNDDAVATTCTVNLVFTGVSGDLQTTTIAVTGLNGTWKVFNTSAIAPTNTTGVQLRVINATTGTLLVTAPTLARTDGVPIFFTTGLASLYPAVTTNATDGYLNQPLINYAQNPSYDVSGGWLVTNGTNPPALSSEHFVSGNSCAKITISGTPVTVTPDYDIPILEGEPLNIAVQAMGSVDGMTGSLTITWKAADNTTTTITSTPTAMTDTGFTTYSFSGIAPQNTKSARVTLNVGSAVLAEFLYVDSWIVTRSNTTHAYFDGTFPNCSYTGAVATALSIGDGTTDQFITNNLTTSDSNYLQMKAHVSNVVLIENNTEVIAVSAASPYTFALSIQSAQGVGTPYWAQFIVTYHDSGDAETGRSFQVVQFGQVETQISIQTASVPATSTHAKLHLYLLGVSTNDVFLLSKGLSRAGDTTTAWVPKTSDPAAAIIAAGQKPAGVLLHNVDFATSWATVETDLPTWNAWDSSTWLDIEQSGL